MSQQPKRNNYRKNKHSNNKEHGFYIMDHGGKTGHKNIIYIDKPFKSEEQARFEINILLKDFPPDSEWHERLFVKEF